MSNIPLDFVGLNTLVKEEIDPNTNTIGKTETKAIDFGDNQANYVKVTSPTGYKTTGPFSFSFWTKVSWNAVIGSSHSLESLLQFAENSWFYLFQDDDNTGNGNTTSFNLKFTNDNSDASNSSKEWSYYFYYSSVGIYAGNLTNGQRPDFWIKWGSWFNVILSWDGNFDNDPVLYIDGTAMSQPKVTTRTGGAGAPTINRIVPTEIKAGYIKDMTNPGNNHDSTAQIQHLAFYNKTLNQDDVGLIYSNGFIENITKIPTLTPFIIDYWKLGDELPLSIGDEIEAGTIIEPTYGQNSLTSVGSLAVSKGRAPETRNKEVILTKVVRTRTGDDYYSMNPDLEDSDGNILYADNDANVIRTNGQILPETHLVALNTH